MDIQLGAFWMGRGICPQGVNWKFNKKNFKKKSAKCHFCLIYKIVVPDQWLQVVL